jgi:hypothetical protein
MFDRSHIIEFSALETYLSAFILRRTIEYASDKSGLDDSLLFITNWLLFITEMECADNLVRTESLDKIQINLFMAEKVAKRQVILGVLFLLSVPFH